MLGKIIKGLKGLSAEQPVKLAVHITDSALNLVELTGTKISRCVSAGYTAGEWQHALHNLLSAVASGTDVHLVLSADFYQLVQLDKPALPAGEMLQALPWQVKDLVSISTEDMVADYIDLPGTTTQQARINVVVASLSWLKQLVAAVEKTGLNIISIQPEEWLASRLIAADSPATMLVVHQPEQEVLIQIVRQGLLYFSRRTRGFSQLHLSSESDLRAGTLDRLQLELQRSMDYFESQLKQPPVRDIKLLMPQSALISDWLHQSGFSQVSMLAVPAIAATIDEKQFINCWPAMAALCRPVAELLQ